MIPFKQYFTESYYQYVDQLGKIKKGMWVRVLPVALDDKDDKDDKDDNKEGKVVTILKPTTSHYTNNNNIGVKFQLPQGTVTIWFKESELEPLTDSSEANKILDI